LAWVGSVFFYAPALWIWRQSLQNTGRYFDYLALTHNPLSRQLAEPILAYRITTPLLAWILHLPDWAALLLPYLFCIAFLGTVFFVIQKSCDPTFAAIVTGLMATTAGIQWINTHLGFADSASFFAASLNLVVQNPAVAIGTTFFGTMNDERYVLSIPFLILWYWDSKDGNSLHNLIRPALWTVVGLLCVIVARHALTAGWIGPGIEKPEVYSQIEGAATVLKPIDNDWTGWSLSILSGYRFAWLLPLVTIGVALVERRLALATILGLLILGSVFATLPVGDVSRSVAYSYPAILLSCRYLYRTRFAGPKLTTRLAMICLGLCLLSPGFIMGGKDHQSMLINYPLPLVLLRTFVILR
jgi:hypothetical protein